MKNKQLSYEELELIEISPSRFQKFKFYCFSWLRNIWDYLIDFCTKEPEIQIIERTDRVGNTYWYIYDPKTDTSFSFASSDEVLVWLERRYYQHNINI